MPRAPPQRKVEDDLKPKKVPRPPNAWILYRTDRLHEWKAARSPNAAPVKQADISRLIASKWKTEPDHVKLDYEKRAAIAKAEHKKKYPDYKYNPISKEVKDKMRAEEREAKKKAREEAKAAKLSGQRVSFGSRRNNSSSPQPSTSDVKLEFFEPEDFKLSALSDPINRGCGPSPPIDYDAECSSTSSGTPFPSSSSSASIRSSPFPSSSSLPPPTPLDASNTWSQPLPSSPFQPPPAYPSTLLHSPQPSRHSSYNLITPSFAPHSLTSTPSDSPPSYTEGEGWQSQPSSLGFQPFAPVPEFQADWSRVSQYPPLLQSEVSFSLPAMDPLLGACALNVNAASAESVYDIVANHSAQSPPGELDLGLMLQHFTDTNDHTHNVHSTHDQFASMLDMAELHETVEDHADDASIVVPNGDAQPFSLEEFAAWVNAHPQTALNLADPNFYLNLSVDIESHYTQPDVPLHQQPFAPDHTGAQFSADALSVPAAGGSATCNMFNIAMQQEIVMPVPTVPVTLPGIGALLPTQVTSFVPTHESLPSTPVESQPPAPAPAPGRYVPPSGATMPSRRRVGRQWPRLSEGSA